MPTNRRDLLVHALGWGVAASVPALWRGARWARAEGASGDDRVLVVLELSGGNDGLSTVVPYEDDALYRVRAAIAVPAKETLALEGGLGLHPNLAPLRGLWDAGRMAVVPGAGYPKPNRSHFESMDIWHTGSVEGRRVPTGWLGRAVDRCCGETPNPDLAVSVGGSVPYALEAERNPPIAFANPAAYRWNGPARDADAFAALNEGASRPGEDDADTLDWLRDTARDARASSDRVRRAAQSFRAKASWPRSPLATELSTVAALITAGLRTRVFYVSLGGFDTHTAQRGRHDNLMRVLGEAVAAFFAEMEAQGAGERVTMLAFSEFGRRVAQNGSNGTDHGTAGPMFLFGRPVKGGVVGRRPSLTDLDDGDLRMTTDFRSVYAAVLERWIGVDATKVLGQRFAPAPVFA
jgi:uncharacterized protein (DUF1501 family)